MEILDNIVTRFGDDLKANLLPNSKLKIAASCFSIYAYEALKKELHHIDSLEFIFTTPSFLPNKATDSLPQQHKEFHIPNLRKDKILYGSEFEIRLKNKLTQKAIAKECAKWIKQKVKFRSNTSQVPMQQFAYLDNKNLPIAYAPISGFTAVDLGYQSSNAISNIINKIDESKHTTTYLKVFQDTWNDSDKLQDVTKIICTHIETIYKENSPEKIYFLILYNIFNEFLEDINDEIIPNDKTGYKESNIWNKLYNFQNDAATGIINKLEKYNGCILADSVGLGKTFTALAVIKYYELRNRSVLVLCPKKLADNWQTYRSNYTTNILAKDRLNYDLLFHTGLSRNSGESMGIELTKINWGNYDLIVIDESHNFRNSGRTLKDKETRYEKLMNAVIKAGVKTKVLMLSATPVNNRFNDLKNQLALAYEGQSEALSKKLGFQKSIEDIFKQAQTVFNNWSKLPTHKRTAQLILDSLDFDFFKLLDSVTIARSRRHIEKFYDTTEIGNFPKRLKPLSFRPPLTNRANVMNINDIYEHLSEIKQAVYAPMNYVLSSRLQKYEDLYSTETKSGKFKQIDREKALQALMRTNLLKRLESSVQAFRITLKKLEERIHKTLKEIKIFKATGQKFQMTEPNPIEDDILQQELEDDFGYTEGKIKIDFADMDITSWQYDLQEDHALIVMLHEEMQKVSVAKDAKLQHLIKHMQTKIDKPINANNRKILLFTAFADTANYLYENIATTLKAQGINTAKITGSDDLQSTLDKKHQFQDILCFFSPKSKERDLLYPQQKQEIEILIATDCISEGPNLQDCDYLINYDIHWNPVRIIQRFGRIDRIGSQNATIQLVNYWPDISLDDYINLKERVENRMHIVDLSSTGDDNVLSAQANDMSYRKEQLRRLQDEVIEMEDLKTGVAITDLGLNDFRMDLLNFMKNNNDLRNLPSGLHTVLPANPEKGLKPGVIFTLRNRNSEINSNQHNHLHPYYLVYIGTNGEIISDHTQVKAILDLTRLSCKGKTEPLHTICKAFNKTTKDGKIMQDYSKLLGQAIASIIEVKQEKDIDSLFTSRKTTALVDSIKGIDDFELITFIVIYSPDTPA